MNRERAEHIEADAAIVLDGFDQGVFVRNTDGDMSSGWAIRLLPFISALARLKKLIDAPDSLAQSPDKDQ